MGVELWTGYSNVTAYRNAYEISKTAPDEKDFKTSDLQSEQDKKPQVEEASLAVQEEDTRSKTADLSNLSLTFHKEETFDYIGSESKLADLDVQKAVSDMKKDSILQEYQYFVGNSRNVLEMEDGIVFQK